MNKQTTNNRNRVADRGDARNLIGCCALRQLGDEGLRKGDQAMQTKIQMRYVGVVRVMVCVMFISLFLWFTPHSNLYAQLQSPNFTTNSLECAGSLGGEYGPDALIFGTVERGETLTFTLNVINTGNVDVPTEGFPAVTFVIFNYASHLENVAIVSVPVGASTNSTFTDSIVVSGIACAVNDTAKIVWTGDVTDPGPDPEGYSNWISTDMSPDYYAEWPGWYARQEPSAYFRLDGVGGSIGDFVFNDLNGDGIMDVGEPGLDDVELHLYSDTDDNDELDTGIDTYIATATTAGGGLYLFSGLEPGTYFVDVVESTLLPGMSLTYGTEPAGPIELSYGEEYLTADFGYFQEENLYDFGDVPDPGFPSYFANDGARHLIGDMWLGGWINGENDTKQTDADEWDDGVIFLGSSATPGGPYEMPYIAGEWGAVQITVRGAPRAAGYVDGWIDWNMDGDWDDDYEHIVDVTAPVPNTFTIEFYVPDDAPAGDTWSRFRLYPEDLDSYDGAAENGEVEDYFLLDGQVAVELTSFIAQAATGRVNLRWTTGSEKENMGFNVLRSTSEDGIYEKVNAALIPGAGTTEEAHEYRFIDYSIATGHTYYYKLVDLDYSGNIGMHGPINIKVPVVPMRYELEQNYPNPFNPETRIGFTIAAESKVRLRVYNLTGQLVKTLLDHTMAAKRHVVNWDGTDDYGMRLPSGVYIYVLDAGDQRISKQMILTK